MCNFVHLGDFLLSRLLLPVMGLWAGGKISPHPIRCCHLYRASTRISHLFIWVCSLCVTVFQIKGWLDNFFPPDFPRLPLPPIAVMDEKGETLAVHVQSKYGKGQWPPSTALNFQTIITLFLSSRVLGFQAPSLSGPLTHLCDLEVGYGGDGIQSWWCGTGIWTPDLLHASQEL